MRFATRWKCGCRSADGHASSILSRCRWSDRFRALVGVLSAWGPLATLRVGSPIACRLWLGCCASSAPGPPVALPPKPPPRRHCSHGGRDWPGSAAVTRFPVDSVEHISRWGWVFHWVDSAFSCRSRPFSRKRQCVSLTRERLARGLIRLRCEGWTEGEVAGGQVVFAECAEWGFLLGAELLGEGAAGTEAAAGWGVDG